MTAPARGTASASWAALQLVLQDGVSFRVAAARCGVAVASVHQQFTRYQLRNAKTAQVWPEDEVTC